MPAAPWRPAADGILLAVRLTPRAGGDSIDGVGVLADGRAVLKARVRAVPEKGAANAALETLLAAALGLPRSSVTVTSGGAARLKTVRLSGDADRLGRACARILGG